MLISMLSGETGVPWLDPVVAGPCDSLHLQDDLGVAPEGEMGLVKRC